MAQTTVSNVIVPEVFSPYVLQEADRVNRLIQSGGAVADPAVSNFLQGGGLTMNVPSWKAIDDTAFEDATDTTAEATVNAVIGAKETVVRQEYAAVWGSANLAAALAGDNPLRQVGNQVAAAVASERQKRIVAMLTGMLGTGGVLASSHVNDQNATAFAPEMLIDTLAPFGDMADSMLTLVVPSAIYRSMQKENLITFRPLSDQTIMFPVFMGQYMVVVDDTMPKTGTGSATVYTNYLLKPGAIRLGVGAAETVLDSEPRQGKGKGIEYIIQRDTFAAHVQGMRFTSDTITGETPSIADLAVTANWAKVYTDKHIPVAALLCRA